MVATCGDSWVRHEVEATPPDLRGGGVPGITYKAPARRIMRLSITNLDGLVIPRWRRRRASKAATPAEVSIIRQKLSGRT